MAGDKAENLKKARAEAQRVLDENHITEPPVPIESVLDSYGLDYEEGEFDESETVGFIDLDEKTIFVDWDASPEKKAFDLARGLGLYLLYKNRISKNAQRGILKRRPLGSAEIEPPEKIVNEFAAHLLVPSNMLEKVKKEYGKLAAVGILAELFGVSKDLIRYRLHKSQDYGEEA